MLRRLLITLLFPVFAAQAQHDRPNILWIVSEDNDPFLGCYGDAFATTPNLDRLASQGILFENAFSTAPVCAPSRNTLITGMYPPALGTEHMRSTYPVPAFVKFFPRYLREAGYYTTNNAKKDYNTTDQLEAWDESSGKATYKNRPEGKPFFAVFNLNVSHESSLHEPLPALKHDPEKVPLPPYHPATNELKHDWAQYYDKIQTMDEQAGKLLAELEEAGLADNTIVFYYSDNGGVLARSKRFMFESGLRVPLIVRFPKKYAHLAPQGAGTRTDRLVTFLDFAPTVLSLAGLPVPAYFQGKAFLGKERQPEVPYVFGFRGRMDERIDFSRSVRDKRFRYIRNYLPHRIYGQHLEYLWRAPSVRSWEAEYKAGRLNEIQSRFWQEKPSEELYDVAADPHNIRNLADNPAYRKDLLRLRKANDNQALSGKDVGFIPEAILATIAEKQPLYDYARSGQYDAAKIIRIAGIASDRKADPAPLRAALGDKDPVVRYWAATGATIHRDKAAEKQLLPLLSDPEAAVRIAAAEALFHLGHQDQALTTLTEALKDPVRQARLQALNVLETLGDAARVTLPVAQTLTGGSADNYDSRAAKTLLEHLKK